VLFRSVLRPSAVSSMRFAVSIFSYLNFAGSVYFREYTYWTASRHQFSIFFHPQHYLLRVARTRGGS